jgi:pilus assembly protein Flp/PilA
MSIRARRLLSDNAGQGLGEYGLILALIATVCVAAVLLIGGDIKGVLSSLGSQI